MSEDTDSTQTTAPASQSYDCAICGSDTGEYPYDTLPPQWEEYLIENRGLTVYCSIHVVVCDSCLDRWQLRRDQGGYGIGAPVDKASELLDELILENLVRVNDVGEEI